MRRATSRCPSTATPAPTQPPRPRLLAPPGGRDAFRRLCAAGGMNEDHIEKAFALEEYDPALPVRVGDLEVSFQPVPHFLPTQAVSVAGNGHRLTYSADSSPSDALCAFARDTDLLLIEATLPRPEREGPRGHLTPERGRRARPPGGRAEARPDPHLGRAGRRLGPPRGRARASADRSRSPPRAPSTA